MSVPHQWRRPLVACWSALHPASSPDEGRRSGLRDRCGVIIMATLIGIALLVSAALAPIPVNLGGQLQTVSRHLTVSEAAVIMGQARTGDLLAVNGLVLQAGGGQPARYWLNGEPCGPETRLRRGDRLAVLPGGDLYEPSRETTTLLPAVPAAGPPMVEPAVQGTRRVRRGLLSGAVAVQTAWAVPTVPSQAATGASRQPRLALTFDDGPWPDTTAALLKILTQHNSHATFFVLGNQAAARRQLIMDIVAQGSEIGIHSWRHNDYTRLSRAAIQADLSRCEAVLGPLMNHPVRWVRPPYGATNRTVIQAITAANYRVAMWSVDTSDWRRPGANAIANHVLKHARDGAVVLCHDGGGDRRGTVAGIAQAVPELKRRGYQLVTLSELKGLQPLPAGGAIVTAGGERYELTPAAAGLQVKVDDLLLELSDPLVEVNGQLMLPAQPILNRLGLGFSWDQTTRSLTVNSVTGPVILRANEAILETADGTREPLSLPVLLYNNQALLPLSLLARLADLTISYGQPVHLTTPLGRLRSPHPPVSSRPSGYLSESDPLALTRR